MSFSVSVLTCVFQCSVNIKFVIVKLGPITTKEGEVVDIFLKGLGKVQKKEKKKERVREEA
jgi:hypothetical protein